MKDNWKQISDDEKELSISDMIFYLLRKWKVIVIAAVAAMIVTGAFSFVKSYVSAKNSADQAPVSQAVVLTDEEKFAADIKIDTINEYLENIDEYNQYLENSIRMKLDPNGFYRGTLTCLFASEDAAETLKALNVCNAQVFNSGNYQKISELLEDSPAEVYVREALSFEQETSENISGENTAIVWKISFIYYDREECQKVMDFICGQMEQAFAELEEGVTAEQVGVDVYLACYADLIKESMSLEVGKSSVYTAMEKVKGEMSDKEKAYYEQSKVSDEELETAPAEQMPMQVGVQWKYVILAAVGVGGLIFVIYAALYLFGNLIRSKEELEAYTSIPVIGLSAKTGRKRNVIDRLIDSLENVVRSEKEDTLEMAVTMLNNYAVQNGVKRIYLSGSRGEKQEEVLAKFRETNDRSGAELIAGSSILEDVEAITEASACDCIVFLEKANKTSHRNIREELRKASHCGLQVLGIILEK